MDFQEILAQASHNAQKGTKLVSRSEKESSEKQKKANEQYAKMLEKKRAEQKAKAFVPPTKTFVIPKKKTEEKKGPSAAGVEAYMARKNAESLDKVKQQRKERDDLIKKRLEANQGRANKKIASTFGKSAIELQTKYAHNSHRELELSRREQKEQEKIDKEASKLKAGIDKATAHRNAVQPKAGQVKGVRVGNVKANGFATISSKHEAVTTKRKSEEFKTMASAQPKKKPQPSFGGGGRVDFEKLMQQAAQNQDAEVAAARAKALRDKRYDLVEKIDKGITKQIPEPESSSKPTSFTSSKTFSKASAKKPLAPPPKPKPTSTLKTSKPDPPKPSTSSMYPKKEQRYLPGDIRYKGPQPGSSKNGEKRQSNNLEESPEVKRPKIDPYKAALSKYSGNGSLPSTISSKFDKPSSSKSTTCLSDKAMEERRRAAMALGRSSSSKKDSSYNRPDKYDRRDDREYGRDSRDYRGRYDRRDDKGYGRNDRSYGRRDDYDDYDDYDDEYDSEMDDFIDDTELDDMQRADFEDTLKSINKNYNKDLWKFRESRIDERRMHANFKDIEMEERRSAKLAMLEDVREAEKGSRAL